MTSSDIIGVSINMLHFHTTIRQCIYLCFSCLSLFSALVTIITQNTHVLCDDCNQLHCVSLVEVQLPKQSFGK